MDAYFHHVIKNNNNNNKGNCHPYRTIINFLPTILCFFLVILIIVLCKHIIKGKDMNSELRGSLQL